MEFWLSFVFVIGFVILHLISKRMKFIKMVPRSRLLSIVGGIAVAYVFLHLLPELGEYQAELEGEIENAFWSFLEHHIYLIAMVGLAIFYGLEKVVKLSKKRGANGENRPSSGVFWIHIGSFTVYNAIIGYLLIREEFSGPWGMFFFFVAMGVHFITNDKSLGETHKEEYDKYGRWLLATSIFAGWFIGVLTEVNEMVISLLVAFISGGIILNVMKEELPEERESSFTAFFIGIFTYSILLFLL
ncbi:hypothetical protein SAMN04487944_10332 [Gracilibacillus ureilyticus]|uniref:ZIP Zinc transporter n=1 Tax=Gracilibacillus ureilyticus TaxID=531814 RepID=A0A1H9NB40_9BACI|nr:hypothetical protein [Gracilibacillus ureilyticus]SER32603.1 hypothetical protein SAMN04487944_10332 [Gracilibacillus ureilyticus]